MMKKVILILGLLVGVSSMAYAQEDPPYGMSQLEAYSLFYENYRTGDYEMALTFGKWMLEAKPREIQGHRTFTLDRQFDRMINIYAGLAEKESDPSEKEKHLDKALEVFDLTFETFSEDEIDYFQWIYKKGRFYQDHNRNLPDGLQKAYELYEQTYEMDPRRFTEMSDGYFARILLTNYASRGEKDQALAMIDEIEDYASTGLMNVINETREQMFDDPEERITFLESRLEQSEDQAETLNELASLYEEVGDRDKATDIYHQLYDLNPNYENVRKLADINLSDANYQEAIDYLKEALEKAPTDDVRKRTALEIAENYQNIDDLRSARQYTRIAIDIDQNWGQPYLRMATIYAAAVQQCTSGRSTEREDRTVYWLAIDYLERAKNVDSSVRGAADRRIEQYEAVMPRTEDKFFRGWEDGESFSIDASIGDCYSWINETTTVK